jgi:hypothetical protein
MLFVETTQRYTFPRYIKVVPPKSTKYGGRRYKKLG